MLTAQQLAVMETLTDSTVFRKVHSSYLEHIQGWGKKKELPVPCNYASAHSCEISS